MYTFEAGDKVLIAIASTGEPVCLDRVSAVADGVVELESGSLWHVSGLSLTKRDLRVSPCPPTVIAQLKREESRRRLREAADILWELLGEVSPVSNDTIAGLEEAFVAAFLEHAQGFSAVPDRNRFLEATARRLDSAEAGAFLSALAPTD